jgi:hypothetical protein
MAQSKQLNLVLSMHRFWQTEIIKDPEAAEHKIIGKRIKSIHDSASKNKDFKSYPVEELLNFCKTVASQVFAPGIREPAFAGMHGLKRIDQICETIGRIALFKQGFLPSKNTFNKKNVILFVSGLVPKGGGVAKELLDLYTALVDTGHDVYFVSSNCVPTDVDIFKNFFTISSENIWICPRNFSQYEQINLILEKIISLKAFKLYPFITHNDVVASSCIQPGIAEEIILDFVYDHGTSLGINNSSLTHIITKNQAQLSALRAGGIAPSISIVPPLLPDHFSELQSRKFRKENFITATAAARSYKIDSFRKENYLNLLPKVLKLTRGTHFHYGPLSKMFTDELLKKMRKHRVPKESFVHVEWAPKLGSDMIKKEVDVFFSPFPVCSARIAIEVMSAGIPMINYYDPKSQIPQGRDFCDPSQFEWSSLEELKKILISLTPEVLKEKSVSARNHFKKNNDFKTHKLKLINISKDLPLSQDTSLVLRDVEQTTFFHFKEHPGFVEPRMHNIRYLYSIKDIKAFFDKPRFWFRLYHQIKNHFFYYFSFIKRISK